jgi:hypothetical protein
MEKVLVVIATMLLGLLFSLPLLVPTAWIVMLILGTFHASYVSVPALSFWLTFLGVFAVRLLVANYSPSSD